MRKLFALIVLPLLMLATTAPAQAHPHVWIDARVTLHMKGGKVVAITQHWTFDAIFSGVVIDAFDKNKDKKLSSGEVKEVRKGAFQNLKNFNYFTTARIGRKELTIEKVSHFSAKIKKGKLAYTFTIVLPRPIDPREDKPAFLFLDKTYYVAVELMKTKPVSVAGKAPNGCKAVIREDTDNPIYFGSVVPYMVNFACPAG